MTTTNLGMTLPVVGADSDVWGNEINTMFNTLDALLAGALTGLTLSAAGGTGTFGIAAGAASGATLASAYTKTTSAWAVGTGTGSLDTGAIANSTWYHVWLIQRSDTLVVDVLVSTSATSPTMPTNYDRKRRIGAMKTDGSAQWVKFSQNGDEFLWDATAADQNPATVGTSASTLTLASVPTGVKVNALISLNLTNAGVAVSAVISSLDIADAATSNINRQLATSGAGLLASYPLNIRTNTSAQIRARCDAASCSLYVGTVGWVDRRGRD